VSGHPPSPGRVAATFGSLTDTLVGDFDLIELLCSVTERVVEITTAGAVGILLADGRGGLRFAAASLEDPAHLRLLQHQTREGPAREVHDRGRRVDVPDLVTVEALWPEYARGARSLGHRSAAVLPIALQGRVLGVLHVLFPHVGGPDVGGSRIARSMAGIALLGILQHGPPPAVEELVGRLDDALQSRVALEQAKGVVAEQLGIALDEAFGLLRGHAQRSGRQLGAVVLDVLERRLVGDDLNAR
jgi:GAF domain-containing protein